MIQAGQFQTRFPSTAFNELLAFGESAEQARQSGSLGDRPLIVLTAGKRGNASEEDIQRWSGFQESFCKLSTRCEAVMAEDSGHRIFEEKPQAVVDAVHQAIEMVATGLGG